jgi:hypothetical protein
MVITENNIIYNALCSITANFEHEDEHVHEHERTAYFATASSEELECSFLLADGALAEWVALQELVAQHAERKRVVQNSKFTLPRVETKRQFLAQVTNPQVFVSARKPHG